MMLATAALGLASSDALRRAPRIGLGMAALGRPGYINLGHAEDLPDRSVEAMRAQAHSVLDEAYALGLRYVDCARSYGLSEQFVASWIEARGDAVGDVVCGSKWGYEYTAGWRVTVDAGEAHEVKKHTREQLRCQLAESRALLPRLSLYQIHSATLESGVLDNAEVLDDLARLSSEGVVVGASVSNPQVPALERARAARRGGKPIFGALQCTFNLLDQTCAAELRRAAAGGVFIIVKEALANGRLTARAEGSTAGLGLLAEEARALGTTVDALALAWVLAHDWVGMCLSGASTAEQLRSNAEALRIAPLLTPELHRRLAGALAQPPEEYWAERKAMEWN